MNLNQKRKGYPVNGSPSDPASWRPVGNTVNPPAGGVTLGEGVFKRTMEDNIAYLLSSYPVDHLLYHFRQRSGVSEPPCATKLEGFWDHELQGSNAGRFLMGAGNTLQWMEHPELRAMMDAVVAGIKECAEENGYMYAFPPEEMLHGAPGRKWVAAQQSNYARAWITLGLLAAAKAGNPDALPLIRAGHDWFNRCEYLPQISNVLLWYQGHIASTEMYFSPAGRTEDITVAETYYVSDRWLERMRAGDLEAIWKDGLNAVHCYLLTALMAYLDHYRATGDERFLEGMLKGWEMIRDHWLHVGGSLAICEVGTYPPDSLYIAGKAKTGETCGSAFWIKFNQQLHNLYPSNEAHAGEIEKSIWNIILANQRGTVGSAYLTYLEGKKEPKKRPYNTCCEGQATRIVGSLPEFIYSVSARGVFVNLFESSTLRWQHQGRDAAIEMTTGFPGNGQCAIRILEGGDWTLHARIPAWATGEVQFAVNGEPAGKGLPGTYKGISRTWQAGDRVTFALPMGVRVTRYRGENHHLQTQDTGLERYAIEYGPLLMAVVGPKYEDAETSFCDFSIAAVLDAEGGELQDLFEPDPETPLHFAVKGHPQYRLIPYWQVPVGSTFTCYPVVV